MRFRRLILGGLLTLSLIACTQDDNQGSPAASSGSPSSTERPSGSPAPAATPEFPAPAELQGTWEAVSDSGSDLVLVIRETGYRLTQSSPAIGSQSATGRIEVDGDEITFSNATACTGDGRYRWSIENDILRFAPIGEDACPGRTGSMADTEYTRSE
jgi:hypothetical protein